MLINAATNFCVDQINTTYAQPVSSKMYYACEAFINKINILHKIGDSPKIGD